VGRNIAGAGVVLLLSSAAFAQPDPPRPEFIVAFIQQNKSEGDPSNILKAKGQFTARNVSLKLLLGEAFGLSLQLIDSFISGAPIGLIQTTSI
jgi:hypothetical protein